MTRLRSLCLLCVSFGFMVSVEQAVEAQVVRNTVEKVTRDYRETRRDYVLDKPFQYQPSDPWYRGKLFQVQTGYYGFFYNCDGEECKRESPYICWKVHTEPDFPRRKRPLCFINGEIDKVVRRIRNGSCRPQAPCATGCSSCRGGGYSLAAKGETQVPQVNEQSEGELVSGPPAPIETGKNIARTMVPFDNASALKSFGGSATKKNATCDCEKCARQNVAELDRIRR